jgi:hypothetical protein
VILQFEKKLWPVKLAGCSSEASSRLEPIPEENKLQVGDACVFELINKDDGVLPQKKKKDDGVLDFHSFRGCN